MTYAEAFIEARSRRLASQVKTLCIARPILRVTSRWDKYFTHTRPIRLGMCPSTVTLQSSIGRCVGILLGT